MKEIFGYELIMDVPGCDLSIMSSKRKLEEYADSLCRLVGMKKYGKTQLPYFGANELYTKGYSMLQFIETSSITGHFSEYWKKAYINLFSCKEYDHLSVVDFTKTFFKSNDIKYKLLVR
uniref:Putative S-adenosylmethionine decarboxylase n=1 Tax=viral metagenome TaxID=1070528 RepID=A0A6M3IRP7_9ZZZZ